MTRFLTLILASTSLAAFAATAQPVQAQDTATASSTSAKAQQPETERLNAWFDKKFEEQLAFSPISQTFLGRKTDYDQIDDYSIEAEDRQLEWMRNATAEMKRDFDYDKLTHDGKISWDMWLLKHKKIICCY